MGNLGIRCTPRQPIGATSGPVEIQLKINGSEVSSLAYYPGEEGIFRGHLRVQNKKGETFIFDLENTPENIFTVLAVFARTAEFTGV